MNRRVEKAARNALPQEIDRQFQYMKKIRERIAGGAPRLAHVVTYGCQQNEADSERILGMLCEMGYGKADSVETADLIVVNTCAVRDHAEKKALSITGGYKHLKRAKPSLLIGICGCMGSKPEMSERIQKSYPYIDFVFGTEKLWELPEILFRVMTEKKRLFFPNVGEPVIAEGLPVERESPFHAWVSIMYGCNNFCTYCIVPYVRGAERSRSPEDILAEVRSLVGGGCKEITLLGQNVNSYGKYGNDGCDFSELLRQIAELPGDFLIRFMTSHPKDATRTLIDTMAAFPKVARQFHLPVQSGSDRVLAAMNRHYTRESYLSLVCYMREKMPDITVTSDIIVGFPGETEADFEDTLSILREARYDMVYSFLYSKRDGTPAAEMENQVPEEIKRERMERLLALQNEISLEKNLSLVGKTLRVLAEGRSKTNADRFTGRTEGGKIVLFDGTDEMTGRFLPVRITRAAPFTLWGEVVE
ncbi:MAG: tRNA (N6-isopentenyl adenosine(37)-C2)-methylthiotransferase MiaB [Clostridiales bacterium]|nr:MAG: tRNA (N6-isopentenyl adenosine(37)-C2)-methylthiotransferase MiaB [Clostridiales bacterium]